MENIEEVSKFTLCVLLTQLGKTFTAISKIKEEISQDVDQGRSIHIIFTMNTLLNNKQFAKRLDVIETTYGTGSVCVFTSKYNGKYNHIKSRLELQGLCTDEITCPRVVVMCSNSQRYDDGVEFLKVIDRNNTNIKRAFSYFDELHNYICDSLRNQIEIIHRLDIIKSIIGLSATPDKIWRNDGFWSNIKMIQLNNFSEQDYVGYNDMDFITIDNYFSTVNIKPKQLKYLEWMDEQTIGFISHVLDAYPEILSDNTRSFIPAHLRRIGHNKLRSKLFERKPSAVIVVINGCEKTLQYKDRCNTIKTLELKSDDEEVCETISKHIQEHNLNNRPLIVTGYLCVSMGQTLTHKDLGSFTHAIFGHLDLTNDEIYQLFGRVTGRMKNWEKYSKTKIYCPTIIQNRIITMEECARSMVYEYNGENVTLDHYRAPMEKLGEIGECAIENIRKPKTNKIVKAKCDDTDKDYKVFSNQEDAISFAKDIYNWTMKKRNDNIAPKTFRKNQDENPTVEYILKRMWGINDQNKMRMLPTNENKWCVYWRPSKMQIN